MPMVIWIVIGVYQNTYCRSISSLYIEMYSRDKCIKTMAIFYMKPWNTLFIISY